MASLRLLDAAIRSFAEQHDDLATLALVGCVLWPCYEEIDLDQLDGDPNHHLHGFFSKQDKEVLGRWFNFLKHGNGGKRNPGLEFDFSPILSGEDRDLKVFSLLYHATLSHFAAYRSHSPESNMIERLGSLFAYEDHEIEDHEADNLILKNIRSVARMFFDRETRATKEQLAHADQASFDSFGRYVHEFLSKAPLRQR